MSIEVNLKNIEQSCSENVVGNLHDVNSASDKSDKGASSAFSIVNSKSDENTSGWGRFFPFVLLFSSNHRWAHGPAPDIDKMTIDELYERASLLEEAAFGQPASRSNRMVSMMLEKMLVQTEIVFRLFNEIAQRKSANDEDPDAPSIVELATTDEAIKSKLAEGSALLVKMSESFHFISKVLIFFNEIKTDGGFDETRRDTLVFHQASVELAAAVYNMTFSGELLKFFKYELASLVINLSRSPEAADIEKAIQLFSVHSRFFVPRCSFVTFDGLGRRLLAANRDAILQGIRERVVSQHKKEAVISSLMCGEEANIDAVINGENFPLAKKLVIDEKAGAPKYYLYSPALKAMIPVSGHGENMPLLDAPLIKSPRTIFKMPSTPEQRVQRLFLEDVMASLGEIESLRLRLKETALVAEKLERK